MWSDTQDQPFAMGLRGTAIKRKLSEQDVGPPAAVAVAAQPQPHLPSKAARADQWGVTEVPTDLGAPPTHHHHQHHNHHHHHHHQQHQTHHHHHLQHHQQNGYNGGGQQHQQQQPQQQQQRFYCFDDYRQLQQQQQQQQQQQCYEQQQQQQTIRRDENGKSYLELGSWSGRSGSGNGRVASSPASRCCEARTNWCVRGPACYRQRRLAVLNISMCKLGRYRQFSDPSLHRSVLICNTLRLIEKEMEQEGYFDAAANAASNGSNDVTSTAAASASAASTEPQFPEVPVPYEPPRVPTPFPPSSSSASDSSSSSSSSVSSTTSSSSLSSSTSDDDRSINWGSVLSLSSQSDLDPLNNNDCLGGGDSSSSDFNHDLDDFLPAWKAVDRHHVSEPSPSGVELESIMHVLVGT